MIKNKVFKTAVGLLLSVSLLSAGMGGNTASAACQHSYMGVFHSSSVRAQATHQFYNEETDTWDNCVRKDIIECYVYRCKKCGEYAEGIGYTKEHFTHSNKLCPFFPEE